MAWINTFDVGPCLVTVSPTSPGAPLFSQTMTKGDTSSFTDGGSGRTYDVAVDADGAVSVSSPSVYDAAAYRLAVEPVSWSGVTGARLRDISVDTNLQVFYASTATSGNVFLTRQGAGTSVLPDPCSLTVVTGGEQGPAYISLSQDGV